MTNLNEKIMSIYKKRKIQRFYNLCVSMLCILTAIGVLSSLVEPALSADRLTQQGDAGDHISDAYLLVGSNPNFTINNNTTTADVIAQANEKYALGIASQFSVFLEEGFDSKEADCEGRMALGGYLNASYHDSGAYNIGKGHWIDSYTSVSFSDLGLGYYNDSAAAIADSGLGYWISFDNGVKYATLSDKVGSNYAADYDTYKWWIYTYQKPIIDFRSTFAMLKARSNQIAQNAKQSTASVSVEGNTVTFDGGAETNDKADVVTFNIDKETWNKISSMRGDNVNFNFINIPKANFPMSGKEVDPQGNPQDVIWDYSNIVINVETDSEVNFPDAAFHTQINGEYISHNDNGNLNNKFGCSSLLWNFSNAEELYLGRDFQGTILSPSADVYDYGDFDYPDGAAGHLSGALIAKSFYGTTEFGYRPYQGPPEVLGNSNIYQIAVDKLDDNGEFLKGATLQVVQDEVVDGKTTEKVIEEWTSGESTEYISLAPGTYKIKEKTAPDNYDKTDKVYNVTITEAGSVSTNITIPERVITPEHTQLRGTNFGGIGWRSYDPGFKQFNSCIAKVTFADNTEQQYNCLPNKYVNNTWYDITEICNLQNVIKIDIMATGSGSCEIATYLNDQQVFTDNTIYADGNWRTVYDKPAETVTIPAVTVPEVKIPITYVPSVTVSVDSNSATYNIPDIKTNYYNINGTITKLQSSTVVNSDDGKEFVVDSDYNLLTPYIRLNDSLNIDGKKNFTFVNTKKVKGASLKLEKVDNNSNLINGDNNAVIELYADKDKDVKLATYNLGSADFKTDDFPTEYLNNEGKLKPGNYYLREITAPNGYLREQNDLSFNVSDEGVITVADDSKDKLLVEGDSAVYTLKFKNTPISKGKMVIKKEWQKYDGTTDDSQTQDITVKVYRTTEKLTNGYKVTELAETDFYSEVKLIKSEEYTKVLYPELTDSNEDPYYYYVVETVPDKYEDSYEIRRWQNHGIADIGLNNIADGYKADPDPNSLKNRDNTATYTKYEGKYAVCQLVEYTDNDKSTDITKQNENKPTKFIIRNKSTEVPIEMPETGGTGTTKFFALGTIMIAGGGLYLVSKNKIKRLLK